MNRVSTSQIRIADVTAPGGGRRWLELNRPEKLNCLNLPMLDQLQSALTTNPAGQIIVTGAGRSFCSGLDLKEVSGPEGGRRHLAKLAAIYRWLLQAQCPTTVLAHGYAVGGGAGLALCAQTVIVAGDFRLRLPAGELSRLAAVVVPLCRLRAGENLPAATGWLGCDLSATEALRLGLVDQVVAPGELDPFRAGKPIPTAWMPSAPRDPARVNRALAELAQVLRGVNAG